MEHKSANEEEVNNTESDLSISNKRTPASTDIKK